MSKKPYVIHYASGKEYKKEVESMPTGAAGELKKYKAPVAGFGMSILYDREGHERARRDWSE